MLSLLIFDALVRFQLNSSVSKELLVVTSVSPEKLIVSGSLFDLESFNFGIQIPFPSHNDMSQRTVIVGPTI